MNSPDIDKFYVSPIDKFLWTFDVEHPLSPSQLREIKKNALIAQKRDNKRPKNDKTPIWEAF